MREYQGVVDRCAAIALCMGMCGQWPVIAKELKNAGKSTKEVLELVLPCCHVGVMCVVHIFCANTIQSLY